MRRRNSFGGALLVLCAALIGCSETADEMAARDTGSTMSSDASPAESAGAGQAAESDATMVAVHLELPGMT